MFYIAFDESHKPRGKITSNYRNLHRHLESLGHFQAFSLLEFPVTRTALQSYDVLVLPCPDFSKLSPAEIKEISAWVKEDGGGLLCLSHAGGDKGRNSNLSELAERFGMIFENDQVLDEQNNFGMDNLPEVTDFRAHPVTEGLESICFRAGCSLTVVGTNAIAVASTGETADPFSTPIIVAAEVENGRIIGCGSYEIFRDRIGGGFNHGQHKHLAENMFNWLITDHRRKLREGQPEPTEDQKPVSGGSIGPLFTGEQAEALDVPGELDIASLGDPNAVTSSNVHIAQKSDLGLELTSILIEFEKLKTRLETVIRAVMQSPDVQEDARAAPQQESQAQVEAGPEPTGPPVLNLPPPPGPARETSPAGEEAAEAPVEAAPAPPPEPEASFSPIPEPPGGAGASVDSGANGEVFSPVPEPPPGEEGGAPPAPGEDTAGTGGPEEHDEAGTTETSEPPAPEPEVEEDVDVEALETELETLQSKIVSLNSLKGFTAKKKDSGKIDEAQYQKQIKKLDQDIKKTEWRIDEIKATIKKHKG